MMKKQSWENNYTDQWHPAAQDVDEWINISQQINKLISEGMDQKKAIDQCTSKMNDVEKVNYMRWVRLYGKGDHLKYSRAQYVGNNGYFLPMDTLKPKSEISLSDDHVNIIKDQEEIKRKKEQSEKDSINKKKSQIASRFDSLERLIRSHDGQEILGDEADLFMETILELKKKFHTIKAKKAGYIFEDMIVREANILEYNGFTKCAELMRNAFDFGNHAAFEPLAMEPNAGSPYGSIMAGQLSGDMVAAKNQKTLDFKPLHTFIEELHNNEKYDDVVEIDESDADDEELVSIAQDMGEAKPEPKLDVKPAEPPAPTSPAPISKEDVKSTPSSVAPTTTKDIDAMIDSVFKDVSVQDVINKLESLSNIFKSAEIPRQLSLVDMMLSALGMGSIFRELPEAMNKALESNNYISSRIDNILYQLKGSLGGGVAIDLNKDHTISNSPETEAVRNKLTDEKEREREKKEQRKKQESEAVEMNVPETPEGSLAGEVEEAAPPPVAPKEKPATPPAPTAPPAKV
jgi:hypothetical protein